MNFREKLHWILDVRPIRETMEDVATAVATWSILIFTTLQLLGFRVP